MKGGRARFINHSCAPNCFAELVGGSGERESGDGDNGGGKGCVCGAGSSNGGKTSRSRYPRVLIRAAVDLRPGEEITYDYCLSGEPDLGGGGGGGGEAGRAHDLHGSGGGGSEVVRCSCGAPTCRGVL